MKRLDAVTQNHPVGAPGASEVALIAKRVGVAVRAGADWTNVVLDVSLTLRHGEITALVGETGSGKTLTALSLIRLLPSAARQTTGRVTIGGLDITGLPDRDMTAVRGRLVSMIFQDPLAALNPVMRVGDQVADPLVVHRGLSRRAAIAAASRLFEQVGLLDVAQTLQKYPHELSGGMRQRVLIAVALSCNPQVLLADEPTTALDVTIQAQILRLLRELAERRGLAVLLVTHDLGTAALVADRVCVMYAGRIVESGPARSVLSNPNHPYTQGLIACIPSLRVRKRPMPVLPGSTEGVWSIPAGCRFAPRCRYVTDRCRSDVPPLIEIASGRHSACWVWAKPGAEDG